MLTKLALHAMLTLPWWSLVPCTECVLCLVLDLVYAEAFLSSHGPAQMAGSILALMYEFTRCC